MPEILLRLGFVARALIGPAPVPIRLGILGVQADDLAEVGNRPVEFALVLLGEAPVVIGLGMLGVQADGLAEVGDRLVVFALGA